MSAPERATSSCVLDQHAAASPDDPASDVEKLARKLQLHARSEEEIFYPAALLVGDVVEGRK